MFSHFSRKDRLYAAIIISAFIFSMETIVGFHTHSLVLLADAIHALNNILTFSTTLSAEKLLEPPPKSLPQSLTSPLLAPFFRGMLLLGLGINLIACAISLFISRIRMQNPLLVLCVGCVSLGLNLLIALAFRVEDRAQDLESGTEMKMVYSHEPYSMHILADLTCNLGVIIAAVIIMQLTTDNRYYADPGASIGIGILIVAFAARLAKTNWELLHQAQGSGLRSSNSRSGIDGHVDEQSGNEGSPSDAGDGTVKEGGEEREDENPWSEDQEDEQELEPREDNENENENDNELRNDHQYRVDEPTHNPSEEDNDSRVMNEDEFPNDSQGEQETDNNFNPEEEHEDPADPYNEENGEQENEDSWDEIPIDDTNTLNPQSENVEPSDDMNQPEEPGCVESHDKSSDPNSWDDGGESEPVTCEEIPSDPCIESTTENEEQKQALQALQGGENKDLGSEGDGVANLIKRAKMALIF